MSLSGWLDKERALFMVELLGFIDYYTLRDRIPFYTTLLYLIEKAFKNRFPRYVSFFIWTLSIDLGLLAVYYMITGAPNRLLTGFTWRYSAPIQYSAQIVILGVLSYKATRDVSYSVALAYNGASATGYLYEVPFWFFSVKPEAHLLHASFRYTFLIDYQIISIVVFLLLLRSRGVKYSLKDLALFAGVFTLSFIMASKMYVIETASVARLPMIAYSLYMGLKLCAPNCGKLLKP